MKRTVTIDIRTLAGVLVMVALAMPVIGPVLAQVMTSPSYQIQSDSLNFGGVYSSSTNYKLEDTFGELGTGVSTSTTYKLSAGYQQMQETFITMTAASNVTLLPSIPGVTGGTATGTTAVNVSTDSPSGYELSILASSSPAMLGPGDSYADYVPDGPVPDYAFGIVATTSEFGYSPEGSDLVQRFLNTAGNVCGSGSLDGDDACWDGLTTSPVVIARDTNPNHPAGATTTLEFRADAGASRNQLAGTYTATTTLTALSI